MSKRIDDFLFLSELKDDFSQDTPSNEKVKKFKELVEKYKKCQECFEKNFEKSKELFSPYCIGYGNITSPIWYIGEAEGGPCGIINCSISGIINCSKCNNKSKDSERYNREVKTKGVLSEEHIKEKVFTPVGKLLKKYSLIKDENEMIDRYINFKFAREIRKRIMREIMKKEDCNLPLGECEFFTEYWRYRVPGDCLIYFIIDKKYKELDNKREKFLLELYEALKPQIIIAYPPKARCTQDKIKKLFKENKNIKIIDLTKNITKNKREIIDSTQNKNLAEDKKTIMIITGWPKKKNYDNKVKKVIEKIKEYFGNKED